MEGLTFSWTVVARPLLRRSGMRTDWLSLAAAPSFALMALATAVLDSSAPAMLCASGHGAQALTGMVPMYALMSAFHAAPWLKLILGGARDTAS
jgi:hypothetical protein